MSAVPQVDVADCRDVRHVTSSLPVLLSPTAHAWLSDRCQLFVGDYRHLKYQQADMRGDGVAVPVPVPVQTPRNHDNQHDDILRQQVEYNDVMKEKPYTLEHTSTIPVCTSVYLLNTFVTFIEFLPHDAIMSNTSNHNFADVIKT